MSGQILPKKRVISHNGNRKLSGRPGPINEKVNGRVISKRLASNNRILSNHRVISGSRQANLDLNDEENDSFGDENAIHFNENKHTILSNFEEWIKLSTDNKITSKNSWQFALIDYFHDLNVIKDGESINFQRASATLDGCVKIYSSRVESVANETGKLLSGLAKNKKEGNSNEDPEDEDDDEDKEETEEAQGDGKKKRKMNRVVESTLVPFDTIQIKKFEQELAIDPLFKKALAEFDEGGAKSLLLNTLNIDKTGRVVFDATTNQTSEPVKDEVQFDDEMNDLIDIEGLGDMLSKDDGLESSIICPTMKHIKTILQDVHNTKGLLSDVNIHFTEGINMDNYNVPSEAPEGDEMSNYDYDDFGGDDYDNDMNEGNNDPLSIINESIIQQVFNNPEEEHDKRTSEQVLDRDLMAYFDERMKVNWRGPEHWRISALKQSKKIDSKSQQEKSETDSHKETTKKKKQRTVIDFFDDDEDDFEDSLFQGPKNPLTMLKNYPEDSSGQKLPEDIQYSSSRLTNLFTKPQCPILCYSHRRQSRVEGAPPLTDEKFFAKQYQEREDRERLVASFHQAEYEDFDNDFEGIDFNDALESTAVNQETEGSEAKDKGLTSAPSEVKKSRLEYVPFSRVAKKIDVKFLKENIWNTIKELKEPKDFQESEQKPDESVKEEGPERSETKSPDSEDKIPPVKKTFGEIVTSVGSLYGQDQKKELSTSFCFICLLHLANEHSLSISTNEKHDDLEVVGF